MKSAKYVEELRSKSLEQLRIELMDAKKELFELRFKNATNQLDKPSEIKRVKKNIARIQTIMTIKEKA